MLISYRYSGIFALANEDGNLLTQLQSISNWYKNTSQDKNKKTEARQGREERLANEFPLISGMKQNEEFWDLLASGPDFTIHANTPSYGCSHQENFERFPSFLAIFCKTTNVRTTVLEGHL